MKSNMLQAIRLTLVCLVFFAVIYTLIVFAIAQLAPNQGKGITIEQAGAAYYTHIGQSFTSDNYFNSRPSAVDYNAAGSGGSNKGPSNPEYLATVQTRIDTFLAHNPGVGMSEIPSELVTASGSGLDPHISVQGAQVQVKRIALKRNLSEAALQQLVQQNTERPLWGFLGPEKVNVLRLNLALDQISINK